MNESSPGTAHATDALPSGAVATGTQTTATTPNQSPSGDGPGARAAWSSVARAVLALALVSLLCNITLHPELEGHLQGYSMVRKTIAKVLSSGTAWAAIAYYAGWKLARPLRSFLGGILAAIATLFIHYVVGSALHIYPPGELFTNLNWFQTALVLCGPIGLAGWLATRQGLVGLLGRLVIPVGALLEPFVLQHFTGLWPQRPWAERYSDVASGIILLGLGVLGAALAFWSAARGRRRPGR